MNNLKKELEVLKSWGIESISIDKILSMVEKAENDSKISLKEQGAKASSAIVDVSPVGGTIFYIDDKADGIYEFFDVDGNLIKDVKVGDRPHAYRVIKKGSVDKYYVYHDEMHMAKRWAYYKNESFVYSAIDSLIEDFLPYIDNWATCDSGVPAVFKKNTGKLLPCAYKWIGSDRPYTIRYGIGVIL